MKAHFFASSLVMVALILAITAIGSWSAVPQSPTFPNGARLATQHVASPMQLAETPALQDYSDPGSVMFVENAGQWDEDARFQVWNGPAGTMWLAEDAIWVTVPEPSTEETGTPGDKGALPGSIPGHRSGYWKQRESVRVDPGFCEPSARFRARSNGQSQSSKA
jgi:hypothetical protein